MNTRIIAIVAVGVGAGFLVNPASAQQLFRDQMNNGAGWGVNASGTDYLSTFNYDYSANGIPEAPNSLLGDDATRGVKLEANLTSGTGQFFTLYPAGQSFSGSYQLRFDAWMNWGTSGTTEFLGGGIGYDGVTADIASGAQALTTGDGGSAADWRALKDGYYVPAGEMAGATRQGSDAYYADFLPSVGGSFAGSPGFQWITWEFTTMGNDVSVFVEKPGGSRLEIISYDKTTPNVATTDGNISLFYADFFTSVAAPADSTFGLIDNVLVTQVPEPTSLALTLLGGIGMTLAFRRRK